MSEQLLLPQHEAQESLPPKHETRERSQESHETLTVAPEAPSADQIESIRRSIQESATNTSEVTIPQHQTHHAAAPILDRYEKKKAHDKVLKQVESSLPAHERTLSKVVHAPIIKPISEAAERTVARPTSLLWGGIFACIASASLYICAKQFGFTYNYLLSSLSFVGGYFLGLGFDLMVRMLGLQRTLDRDSE
jgi:hypothetical protein